MALMCRRVLKMSSQFSSVWPCAHASRKLTLYILVNPFLCTPLQIQFSFSDIGHIFQILKQLDIKLQCFNLVKYRYITTSFIKVMRHLQI